MRKQVILYWKLRKKQLQEELPKAERDKYYCDLHPRQDFLRRVDLPILFEMCKWLGIGGEELVKELGHGFPLIGIVDNVGTWKRKNKSKPKTKKKDLLSQTDK